MDDFVSDFFLILSAPFVGSFLGLLAYRLPRSEAFALGRSRCPSCKRPLTPSELIPILSWLASKGRCRRCGTPISADHVVAETGALLIAVWSVWGSPGLPPWILAFVGWALLLLSIIDWRTRLLPNTLTIPLLLTGLFYVWLFQRASFWDHALGAIIGFLSLFVVGWIYQRARGTVGLGGGDAKLFAAAGAWLTWTGLPSVLLVGSASALVFAAILSFWRKRAISGFPIPFGPFLGLGFWLVLIYGPIALY